MRKEVNIPKIGEAWIDGSYQNNMYNLNFGGLNPEADENWHPSIRQKYHANFTFLDNGSVLLESIDYTRVSTTMDARYFSNTGEIINQLRLIAQWLWDQPEIRGRIEQYRKDALRRLDASVPRLAEELSGAITRQAALRNVLSRSMPLAFEVRES